MTISVRNLLLDAVQTYVSLVKWMMCINPIRMTSINEEEDLYLPNSAFGIEPNGREIVLKTSTFAPVKGIHNLNIFGHLFVWYDLACKPKLIMPKFDTTTNLQGYLFNNPNRLEFIVPITYCIKFPYCTNDQGIRADLHMFRDYQDGEATWTTVLRFKMEAGHPYTSAIITLLSKANHNICEWQKRLSLLPVRVEYLKNNIRDLQHLMEAGLVDYRESLRLIAMFSEQRAADLAICE